MCTGAAQALLQVCNLVESTAQVISDSARTHTQSVRVRTCVRRACACIRCATSPRTHAHFHRHRHQTQASQQELCNIALVRPTHGRHNIIRPRRQRMQQRLSSETAFSHLKRIIEAVVSLRCARAHTHTHTHDFRQHPPRSFTSFDACMRVQNNEPLRRQRVRARRRHSRGRCRLASTIRIMNGGHHVYFPFPQLLYTGTKQRGEQR